MVAAHQAGIDNTVAACGTALSVDHLARLGTHARTVTLAFDSDQAGRRAMTRAFETAAGARAHLGLRIARPPEDQDPAALVAAGRNEELRNALSEAVPLEHHLMDWVIGRYPSTSLRPDPG